MIPGPGINAYNLPANAAEAGGQQPADFAIDGNGMIRTIKAGAERMVSVSEIVANRGGVDGPVQLLPTLVPLKLNPTMKNKRIYFACPMYSWEAVMITAKIRLYLNQQVVAELFHRKFFQNANTTAFGTATPFIFARDAAAPVSAFSWHSKFVDYGNTLYTLENETTEPDDLVWTYKAVYRTFPGAADTSFQAQIILNPRYLNCVADKITIEEFSVTPGENNAATVGRKSDIVYCLAVVESDY